MSIDIWAKKNHIRELRSKLHKSFKNSPSTCPPNTTNFDPAIVTACPYRPTGLGPLTVTRVHSRDTCGTLVLPNQNIRRSSPRFNKYNPSSCFSFSLGSVFVSPPHTIRTLLTSALACPTRADGISPPVWRRVAELSRVAKR